MFHKTITPLIMAYLLIGLILPADSFANNGHGEFVPEEIVLQLLPGGDINAINSTYGTHIKSYMPLIDSYLLGTEPGVNAENLATVISGAEITVAYCTANYFLDSFEPFQRSQPFLDEPGGAITTQYSFASLNLADANLLSTGSNVKIAIVDGGVNLTHPLLAGRVTSGFDYVDGDTIATDVAGGPGSGHGTFIAGLASMVAPGADLIAYRTLDTLGRGNGYTIAESILQAIADGCRVINLSIGMRGRHPAVDDAIEYAKANNIFIVTAAGNDSTDDANIFPFPAYRSYTYTVAAVDSNNVLASFSNFGGDVDLCAPGVNLNSAYLDTTNAYWDGTSFAAPFVAGVVAAMLAVDSTLTWDEIDSLLEMSATDIDGLNPGFEGALGKGLINPVLALQLAGAVVCGDVDGSGFVDIDDAVYLIQYIFLSGPGPVSPGTGDPNCSGAVDIDDVVYLINYIFNNGSPPCSGC